MQRLHLVLASEATGSAKVGGSATIGRVSGHGSCRLTSPLSSGLVVQGYQGRLTLAPPADDQASPGLVDPRIKAPEAQLVLEGDIRRSGQLEVDLLDVRGTLCDSHVEVPSWTHQGSDVAVTNSVLQCRGEGAVIVGPTVDSSIQTSGTIWVHADLVWNNPGAPAVGQPPEYRVEGRSLWVAGETKAEARVHISVDDHAFGRSFDRAESFTVSGTLLSTGLVSHQWDLRYALVGCDAPHHFFECTQPIGQFDEFPSGPPAEVSHLGGCLRPLELDEAAQPVQRALCGVLGWQLETEQLEAEGAQVGG